MAILLIMIHAVDICSCDNVKLFKRKLKTLLKIIFSLCESFIELLFFLSL